MTHPSPSPSSRPEPALGDAVFWISQASGRSKEKHGIVAYVGEPKRPLSDALENREQWAPEWHGRFLHSSGPIGTSRSVTIVIRFGVSALSLTVLTFFFIDSLAFGGYILRISSSVKGTSRTYSDLDCSSATHNR